VVCREYANAEQRGQVERKSERYAIDSEGYPRALYRDGERKGWF
jgi:hypothetical protein